MAISFKISLEINVFWPFNRYWLQSALRIDRLNGTDTVHPNWQLYQFSIHSAGRYQPVVTEEVVKNMGIKLTGIVTIVVAILGPIVWLPGMVSGNNAIPLFSQYLGMSAIIAMAISMLIATRWPGIERVFGALDQSYRLHKWLGLWAIATTFLHDTIDADIEGSGGRSALGEIAETAGEIGLNGLLILVLITVATFIPYHLWKWTHRFIGVFFVLSVFHYLFIEKPFSNIDPLGLYMLLACIVGLVAYIYTSMPRRFRPAYHYRIDQIEKQGDALAVSLLPEKRVLRHLAGQFCFISFEGLGLVEPHPFTLSAPPHEDGRIRMTIGPLGDYTMRLISRLEVGATARVEGPFGDFKIARGSQIWIAAGIGITPFAAMAGSLQSDEGPVTLYYTVKSRQKAAHLEDLESIASSHPNFQLVLRESSIEGRLSAAQIIDGEGSLKNKHVLYCGPAILRKALWEGMRDHGLSARRFHYELFEIRTGIGLNYLFNYIVNRTLSLKK